jgi:hypothetical protein
MRKLIRWLVLVMLLSSCTPPWICDDYDPRFSNIPPSQETTVAGICGVVAQRVHYTSDGAAHHVDEYWQSPDQTWTLQSGDCEDYALLVMYLIHVDLGGWPQLACGGQQRFDGTWAGHAWVEYNGREYEPQNGFDVTDNPRYSTPRLVSYGHAMWRSMNTHRSMIGGDHEVR